MSAGTHRRVSRILRELAADPQGGPIDIDTMSAALGQRSYGLLLVVLGLPAWIPVLPPGVPSLFGLALGALALQLLLGRPTPWLPRFIGRQSLSQARLAKLVRRAAPWLERAEQFARPRLDGVISGTGTLPLGFFLLLLALLLCVPLPMTNSGPAATFVVFGIALLEKDGALALAGYLLGLASLAVMVLFWGGTWFGLQWLLGG